MRVVGGILSGRRIAVPKAARVRPTSDRVREALMSALSSRNALQDANVLDLFAGSGAMSLETLSRGAKHALAIDSNKQCIKTISDNAVALGVRDNMDVARVDLLRTPGTVAGAIADKSKGPFSLLIADPPYRDVPRWAPLIEAICNEGLIERGAYVVLEHASEDGWLPQAPLALESKYKYGDTGVTLAVYRLEEGPT